MRGMAMNLNGDVSIPSGDEYDLWLESVNLSLDDWSGMDFDWPQLKKTSYTTLGLSGSSVAMPDDYVKLDGFPMVGGTEYSEIRPEEINLHSDGRYVIPVPSGGYMTVYPAAASVMTVSIPYVGKAVSFASPSDTSVCPSDNFLIYSATAKIFLQRDNPKYEEFKTAAAEEMIRMINREAVKLDQYNSTIKNKLTRRFTLGID